MAKFNVIGKYFTIENKATGTMMGVKEGLTEPRTPVVTWKTQKGDNQVWCMDPLTDTIRNKQSHLCLDMDVSGRVILNPYEKNDTNQKWKYNSSKDVLENIANPVKVLDIPGGSKAVGDEVCATEFHGGNAQKWSLDGLPIRYFAIRSLMCEKVLDILGEKSTPGSRVILWNQKLKSADSQLWFEDKYGNVRSKLNVKLVLDGFGNCVVTGEHKLGKPRCYWVMSGNRIVNKEDHNEVISVKDRLSIDGAELNVRSYRGDISQHWSFEYA
jgi:hypothetical protein